MGFDGIGGYGIKTEPSPAPTGLGINQAVLGTLGSINKGIQDLARVMEGRTPAIATQPDTSFSEYAISLLTAHTDFPITVPGPCDFIQAWCDGAPDGISLKLHTQDNKPIQLERFITLPVQNPKFIYLTNDIRQGRSQLVLYFSRGNSLGMYLGGEPAHVSRAELAARLGSIVSFDRRGEIIFADDFENGRDKWEEIASADFGIAALSIAEALSGSTSLKITTGAVGGGITGVYRFCSYPLLTRFGFGFSFLQEDSDLIIYLYGDVYDGTNYYAGRVRYDKANTKWQYQDSAGAWQDLVTSIDYEVSEALFTSFKLVVDPNTGKYVRLVLPNGVQDMSNIAMQQAAAAVTPHLIMAMSATSTAASHVGFFDNALITQNEP